MRLRVLDLPLADDVTDARFALVVDGVDLDALPAGERASLQEFADKIGAAGVLVSGRRVDIESMTPLIELRSDPGLLDRLLALREAITRRLPPAAGKRIS